MSEVSETTEMSQTGCPVCGRSFPGVGSDQEEAKRRSHAAYRAHLVTSPACLEAEGIAVEHGAANGNPRV